MRVVAGVLSAAILILLAVRVFGHGEPVELDDLLGIPQLLALVAVIGLFVMVVFRTPAGDAALAMIGLAANGLMLVLFPERMPDTTRGGTLMTAFWGGFGGALIALAWGMTLVLARSA
jgi:hypothetical protein